MDYTGHHCCVDDLVCCRISTWFHLCSTAAECDSDFSDTPTKAPTSYSFVPTPPDTYSAVNGIIFGVLGLIFLAVVTFSTYKLVTGEWVVKCHKRRRGSTQRKWFYEDHLELQHPDTESPFSHQSMGIDLNHSQPT